MGCKIRNNEEFSQEGELSQKYCSTTQLQDPRSEQEFTRHNTATRGILNAVNIGNWASSRSKIRTRKQSAWILLQVALWQNLLKSSQEAATRESKLDYTPTHGIVTLHSGITSRSSSQNRKANSTAPFPTQELSKLMEPRGIHIFLVLGVGVSSGLGVSISVLSDAGTGRRWVATATSVGWVGHWQVGGWMRKPGGMPELNQYHRWVALRAIAMIKKLLTNGTQIWHPLWWHSIYV
jgi:hypothetical protein